VNHVLSSLPFAQSSNGESGVVLRGRVSQVDSQYQLSGIKIDETTLWARDQGFAIGTMVRLYLPANNVSLARQEPSTSSIQNTLKVRVEAIETDTHPASCLVRLRHGEHLLLARVTRRAVEQLSLKTDSWVWAQLKSVAVSQTS
jgi:molybdate transport system ATP-binding protein